MTNHLRSLLEQYNKHNGRGNMIAANQTMVEIIETLAGMISPPCQCACNDPRPLGANNPDDLLPIKRGPGRPRKLATEPHAG